jgi:hypothetical protein
MSQTTITDFAKNHRFVAFSFYGIETVATKDGYKKIPLALPIWHTIKKTQIYMEHKAFAIRTGRISNITVIDCDNIESYNQMTKAFPSLSQTLTVKTPRGYHIYCRYFKRITSNANSFKSFPHVDIRSDQAIVFAPFTTFKNVTTGSTETYMVMKEETNLVEIPFQLIADLKQPRKKTKPIHAPPKSLYNIVPAIVPTGDLQMIDRLVRSLPESYLESFNTWFQIGGCIHFESNGSTAAKQLFLQLSRSVAKYANVTDKEIDKIWNYFSRTAKRGCGKMFTIATLFHFCKTEAPKTFHQIQEELYKIPDEPFPSLFFE